MTSDADRFVMDLFRQSGDWTPLELETMAYVYQRHNQGNEELVQLLIRVKVFQRTAIQVVKMMQAGQLKPPHLSFLFQSNGAALLRNSLKVESERKVVREARMQADPEAPPSAIVSHFATPASASTTALGPMGSQTRMTGTKSSADLTIAPTNSLSVGGSRIVGPGETPRVGMVLGKCLLTGLLGQGGNGKVFSGLHQTLNMQVAIKVLTVDASELAHEQIEKLASEARLLAQLNHPNVIRCIDYDNSPIPYVTMEYVEGLSLADLIEQTGGLRVPRTADIMIQVARGLAAAWDVGMVHRDIKPGNILMTKTGIAKVTDMGLAFRSTETEPPSSSPPVLGAPIGTCGYISPEQVVNDSKVDFRTDIYSLGATFYHAITGRLPFPSKSPRQMLMMHMNQPVHPPHLVAPGVVDEETSAVICRMMEKNPDDRYSSYDELIAELIPLAQGVSSSVSNTNTPGKPNATPSTFRHKTYR
jgi:hypothetical protein